ncbi:MAG: hypothetical protein OEV88_05165 [Gammaproteobacteria bacterium]|jgi:hypothetical protein|nr:hypothetical protein [Gammaproteobacteria bacterium]
MMRRSLQCLALCASVALAGCATATPDVTGSGSQLQTRQLQTRDYDTLDKEKTMRSVVATLQDLGFTIDTADPTLGTITGSRVYYESDYKNFTMRMTVTVREMEGKRVAVRANARLNDKAVADPLTYQDFFAALDKAMFLTLQQVD